MRLNRRLRDIFITALVSAIIAKGAALTNPVKAVEAFFLDLRQSKHAYVSQASDSIVIIAIDDPTLSSLEFTSPLNRKFLATVLQKLDKSGARVIGVDYLLDRPTVTDDDAYFTAQLESMQTPVVLLSDPGREARQAICAGQSVTDLTSSTLPQFADNATVAHGVLCADRLDDVVRSVSLARSSRNFSFAESLHAVAAGHSDIASVATLDIPYGLTATNTWPFATYSAQFMDIYPDSWFQDRIVLIGDVTPYSGDWLKTPLRFSEINIEIEPKELMPSGKLPGVVVHAYALHGLLENEQGPHFSWSIQFFLALLGALAGALIGQSQKSLKWVSALCVGFLVGSAFLIYSVAAWGVYLPYTVSVLAMGVALAGSFGVLERRERHQKNSIRAGFEHFLAPQIVAQFVKDPSNLKLETTEREITALFTDLAGFTSFVDSTPPDTVTVVLNAYLDIVVDTVVAHDGVVDKIVGDAVHALFSAPVEDEEHRQKALLCALEVERRTEAFRSATANKGITIGETRIGVNSGVGIIGNFGSSRRFDYTAHGSVINLAARLEAENKKFGTRICVSAETLKGCESFLRRYIGPMPIRGVQDHIDLYELLQPDASALQYLEEYKTAMQLKENHQTNEALAAFERLVEGLEEDGLVAFQESEIRARLEDEQTQSRS